MSAETSKLKECPRAPKKVRVRRSSSNNSASRRLVYRYFSLRESFSGIRITNKDSSPRVEGSSPMEEVPCPMAGGSSPMEIDKPFENAPK